MWAAAGLVNRPGFATLAAMEVVSVIYHIAVLIGLFLAPGIVLANLACFTGLRSAPPPDAGDAPLVSILVPARNEVLNIEACVGSPLGPDFACFEIIVVGGQSA